LPVGLPPLISAGHMLAADGGDSGQRDVLLAGIYTLATRMLIKLDDQQLEWMAADRARVLASGGGFSPATVELHRVSAENYVGDAVAAALRIVPSALPTTERHAR
jgi:hypothetical protein